MIRGENQILQAFLGTLMTWGLTAAGAATVFIFSVGNFSSQRKYLDGSLGFAAGVMTAASYWSLLSPAIDKAEKSGTYGEDGKYAFAPVAIGFALGGLFVLLSDLCIPKIAKDPAIALAMQTSSHQKEKGMLENQTVNVEIIKPSDDTYSIAEDESEDTNSNNKNTVITDEVELKLRKRTKSKKSSQVVLQYQIDSSKEDLAKIEKYKSWKRILLLIIAITVHNIPEGLAVGVSFGAISSNPNSTSEATFESARNLAIGIGIQNFPEGMAVSVPLCAAGYTPLKSFWYGQLSGMVEPIFGVLGALVVMVAEPLLPYALAFAAGAMIYVVVDDIIPEANMCGNGRIASWGTMVGFIVMMCLDVALG